MQEDATDVYLRERDNLLKSMFDGQDVDLSVGNYLIAKENLLAHGFEPDVTWKENICNSFSYDIIKANLKVASGTEAEKMTLRELARRFPGHLVDHPWVGRIRNLVSGSGKKPEEDRDKIAQRIANSHSYKPSVEPLPDEHFGKSHEFPLHDIHNPLRFQNAITGRSEMIEMLRRNFLPRNPGALSEMQEEMERDKLEQELLRKKGSVNYHGVKDEDSGEREWPFRAPLRGLKEATLQHQHQLYKRDYDRWENSGSAKSKRLDLEEKYPDSPERVDYELRKAHFEDRADRWESDDVQYEKGEEPTLEELMAMEGGWGKHGADIKPKPKPQHDHFLGDDGYFLGLEWLTPEERSLVRSHIEDKGLHSQDAQEIVLPDGHILSAGRLIDNIRARYAPAAHHSGRSVVQNIPSMLPLVEEDTVQEETHQHYALNDMLHNSGFDDDGNFHHKRGTPIHHHRIPVEDLDDEEKKFYPHGKPLALTSLHDTITNGLRMTLGHEKKYEMGADGEPKPWDGESWKDSNGNDVDSFQGIPYMTSDMLKNFKKSNRLTEAIKSSSHGKKRIPREAILMAMGYDVNGKPINAGEHGYLGKNHDGVLMDEVLMERILKHASERSTLNQQGFDIRNEDLTGGILGPEIADLTPEEKALFREHPDGYLEGRAARWSKAWKLGGRGRNPLSDMELRHDVTSRHDAGTNTNTSMYGVEDLDRDTFTPNPKTAGAFSLFIPPSSNLDTTRHNLISEFGHSALRTGGKKSNTPKTNIFARMSHLMAGPMNKIRKLSQNAVGDLFGSKVKPSHMPLFYSNHTDSYGPYGMVHRTRYRGKKEGEELLAGAPFGGAESTNEGESSDELPEGGEGLHGASEGGMNEGEIVDISDTLEGDFVERTGKLHKNNHRRNNALAHRRRGAVLGYGRDFDDRAPKMLSSLDPKKEIGSGRYPVPHGTEQRDFDNIDNFLRLTGHKPKQKPLDERRVNVSEEEWHAMLDYRDEMREKGEDTSHLDDIIDELEQEVERAHEQETVQGVEPRSDVAHHFEKKMHADYEAITQMAMMLLSGMSEEQIKKHFDPSNANQFIDNADMLFREANRALMHLPHSAHGLTTYGEDIDEVVQPILQRRGEEGKSGHLDLAGHVREHGHLVTEETSANDILEMLGIGGDEHFLNAKETMLKYNEEKKAAREAGLLPETDPDYESAHQKAISKVGGRAYENAKIITDGHSQLIDQIKNYVSVHGPRVIMSNGQFLSTNPSIDGSNTPFEDYHGLRDVDMFVAAQFKGMNKKARQAGAWRHTSELANMFRGPEEEYRDLYGLDYIQAPIVKTSDKDSVSGFTGAPVGKKPGTRFVHQGRTANEAVHRLRDIILHDPSTELEFQEIEKPITRERLQWGHGRGIDGTSPHGHGICDLAVSGGLEDGRVGKPTFGFDFSEGKPFMGEKISKPVSLLPVPFANLYKAFDVIGDGEKMVQDAWGNQVPREQNITPSNTLDIEGITPNTGPNAFEALSLSEPADYASFLLNPDVLLLKGDKNPEWIPPIRPMHRIFELNDLEQLRGFTGSWVVSKWYDGQRVVITSKKKRITAYDEKGGRMGLPDWARQGLKKMNDKTYTIDGVLGDDELHIIDIMQYDGTDIMDLSVNERLKVLRGQFDSHDTVMIPGPFDTRITDEEGLEGIVNDLLNDFDTLLLRDSNSTYMRGEIRHPKWVLLRPGKELNFLVLDRRGSGPYTYRLGAGPLLDDEGLGNRAVKYKGSVYLDAGTIESPKPFDEGEIIRVNVSGVKQFNKGGRDIYTVTPTDVKGEGEGEGVVSMETLGLLTKSLEPLHFPHDVKIIDNCILVKMYHDNVIYNLEKTQDGYWASDPETVLSGISTNDYSIRLSESLRPFWTQVTSMLLKGKIERVVEEGQIPDDTDETMEEESAGLLRPGKDKNLLLKPETVKGLKLIEEALDVLEKEQYYNRTGPKGLGIDVGSLTESPRGPTKLTTEETMPDYDMRVRPTEDAEKPYKEATSRESENKGTKRKKLVTDGGQSLDLELDSDNAVLSD